MTDKDNIQNEIQTKLIEIENLVKQYENINKENKIVQKSVQELSITQKKRNKEEKEKEQKIIALHNPCPYCGSTNTKPSGNYHRNLEYKRRECNNCGRSWTIKPDTYSPIITTQIIEKLKKNIDRRLNIQQATQLKLIAIQEDKK